MRISLVAALVTISTPALAQTQAPDLAGPNVPPEVGAKTATVVPGDYRVGRIKRAILGEHYRELWATPITVPVLDLGTYAGGLKPDKKAGSRQTIGLRFKAGDGMEYNFRSVDKEPANALPPALRNSPIEKIFQDQMSAEYPAGAIIVAALLEKVGVLHPRPVLYVMPDDPRLGEFREEFAGLLGTIEEHRPKFPGAINIVETLELFDSLRVDAGQRVDARGYLRARLMDIIVGDWDRHSDQWQWAAFPNGPGQVLWQPVPEDRDWAFSKMDGPIALLVRQYYPQTIGFGKDYPRILDLTWTGKDLDRRLLPPLSRQAWDSVVTDIRRKLTDDAIDDAIRVQPAPFVERQGAWLKEALRNRRDHLPEAATEFYDLLAREVDVHATDEAEQVEIESRPDASLDIIVRPLARGSRPTFQRRFLPAETREVRVYLHAGKDVVLMRGLPGRDIRVRVIGDGADVLNDSTRSGMQLYEDRAENYVVVDPEDAEKEKKKREKEAEQKGSEEKKEEASAGDSVPELMASETFGPLPRPSDFMKTYPIDFGKRWVYFPWVSYHPGQGVTLGLQFNRFSYGFRAIPYRKRVRVKGGWAFGGEGPRFEAYAEDRHLFEFAHERYIGARVDLRATTVETVRFYGYGNETLRPQPDEPESSGRYLELMLRLAPILFYKGEHFHASVGPMVQLTDPRPIPGSRLDLVAPLGTERLVLAGVDGKIGWDVGQPMGEGLGGRINFDVRVAGSLRGASARFGRVGTEAAVFSNLPVPMKPILAVRAGATKVEGVYPFQEAALLGGQSSVRGYNKYRFAGDAAVFAGSEIRVPIFDLKGNDIGMLALADVGRVYLAGETSARWHTGYGVGAWAGRPGGIIVNGVIAISEERTAAHVYTGFGF